MTQMTQMTMVTQLTIKRPDISPAYLMIVLAPAYSSSLTSRLGTLTPVLNPRHGHEEQRGEE